MCDRCSKGRDSRDTDVRPGACRRARGRDDDHRETDVSQHEADEAARQSGDEAPEPDCDEEESVQALEYPR